MLVASYIAKVILLLVMGRNFTVNRRKDREDKEDYKTNTIITYVTVGIMLALYFFAGVFHKVTF